MVCRGGKLDEGMGRGRVGRMTNKDGMFTTIPLVVRKQVLAVGMTSSE